LLVLADPATGDPLVVLVSSPRTIVSVLEDSEHVMHIALAIEDGFAVPVHFVLAREVGAKLLAALAPTLGAHAAWLLDQGEYSQEAVLRLVAGSGDDSPDIPSHKMLNARRGHQTGPPHVPPKTSVSEGISVGGSSRDAGSGRANIDI
jgi:hypothetical protein